MYKKLNSFVYKFDINFQVFLNNSIRVYSTNNTFRNTIFKISANVPLNFSSINL